MKTITLIAVVIASLSQTAWARDDRIKINIAETLALPKIQEAIMSDVKLFFGNQEHPAATQTLGEFQSNKKTNAFNKSDVEACQWAFASALQSLQTRALREGGNAIVGIYSNYRGQKFVSDTEFECGAGAIMAGTSLKGRVVKLPE